MVRAALPTGSPQRLPYRHCSFRKGDYKVDKPHKADRLLFSRFHLPLVAIHIRKFFGSASINDIAKLQSLLVKKTGRITLCHPSVLNADD